MTTQTQAGKPQKTAFTSHAFFEWLEMVASKQALIQRANKSHFGPVLRRFIPAMRGHCSFFPGNVMVLADGDVTTCCNDFLGKNAFANTSEASISEVWNNQINQIGKTGLYSLPWCKGCLGSHLAPYFPKDSSYQDWRDQTRKPLKSLQIEIVARCNYDCCSSNEMKFHRKRTMADLDEMFDSIEDVLPTIEDLYFFNNGEPLLHPGFCDFVKRCRAVTPKARFHISTNGLLLNQNVAQGIVEEQFHNVTVSVHGGPGTDGMLRYSKFGADYPRVLRNVKRLTTRRNERGATLPNVELKAVLFNWNDTDELMDTLRADAREAGANRVFWVLDWNGPSDERSSKRFLPGSAELQKLIERGEFLNYGVE
jgi:hypothetical protein